MRIFVSVADRAGFASGARDLRMSPPAVTRAIAALETAIGTRLLIRSTRSVKLTEAGGRYLEDCRRILAEIEDAEAGAAGSFATATGTLTVTASVQFGRLYVLPIITAYLGQHPAVFARTLFLDRVVNMIEEGADVAVRIGSLEDVGLTAIRVGTVRRIACAAPAYLARHGTPKTPRDLQRHATIGFWNPSASPEWRFGRDRTISAMPRSRLICNTVDAALAAAIDGHGIARFLSYQVAPAVAAGLLTILFQDEEAEPLPIHVVHPDGRRASAKVRAFIDLAVDRLRANPLIR